MSFQTFDVDQVSLISAINKELAKQSPGLPFETALFNKVIDAANLIVEECARERVYATISMSPKAWLESDDVGLSSRYMLTVLAQLGHPMPDGDTPKDADDLGRCIRMVEACGLESEMSRLESMGEGWRYILNNWDGLKAYYKNEDYEEVYSILSKCPT